MRARSTRRPALLLLGLCLLLACSPSGGGNPAPAAPSKTSGATAPTTGAGAPPIAAPTTVASAKPAAADDAALASFYRGKTVRIIVGYPPGGGFDVVSRLVSKYLGRYIPGNPTVIVENMPGAVSMVGLNHVYNVAPKDGTVIANSIGSLALQQAFGAPGVQFDMGQVQYLGTVGSDTFVVLVNRATTGVSRMEELLNPSGREVVLGASAPGATATDGTLLLRDVLQTRTRVVLGYPGTAAIRLAIESGEVDGMLQVWEDLKRTDRERFESGEYVVLAVFAEEPLAELPSAPLIQSFARTDAQRQLFRLGVIVPTQILRPYMVAPQVPAERVQALRAAFAQTVRDPEFVADAQRSNLPVDPLDGEQVGRLARELLAMPPDLRDQLKGYLQQ